MKKAVILVSGGLDSTTVLAMAKEQGYELYALSFDYGQRHAVELECVRKVISCYPVVHHKIIRIDLRAFGGSALTSDVEVPKSDVYNSGSEAIPVTYVPARNTIFLSFALGFAETIGARDIFIGVHSLDYSNYPDCRPEYLAAFEIMANLATAVGINEGGIKIQAPLILMTKSQIIKEGTRLGVDYSMTNSCYDPADSGESCGKCDACHIRISGFKELGLVDPVPYQNKNE
jgi:7-cyano-7-deazaguanine synthase